jgi:hypothetical protein
VPFTELGAILGKNGPSSVNGTEFGGGGDADVAESWRNRGEAVKRW